MNSHHHRIVPTMWAMMGIVLFATLTVALLELDSAATGYVAAGLLVACLLICVVAYWADNRTRPGVEEIRKPEGATT